MKLKLVAALFALGVTAFAQDSDPRVDPSALARVQEKLAQIEAQTGGLDMHPDAAALAAMKAAELSRLTGLEGLAGLGALSSLDAADLNEGLAQAQAQLSAVKSLHLPDMSALSSMLMAQDMAFAQSSGSGRSYGGHSGSSLTHEYDRGKHALDKNQFGEAVNDFNEAIEKKDSRADGAYYWKAYAQSRLGHRSEALATISQLRSSFPQSRWIDDARALEVEIHSQEGKPVNPESENNEELKLMALNSLMQSDSSQAIPILKKLLVSNQSPAIKDKAMFVLSQSGSPEARQVIVDMARGKSNPDLQIKAIQYINMSGDREARSELTKIYASSSDVNLKREIIRDYIMSGSKDQLLVIAKGEKNPDLRREAIHTLAQSGARDEMFELYKAETSPEMKEEIVHSMLMDGDSVHLAEIARTDKDPNVRKAAINTYALAGGRGDDLANMYRTETDSSIKRELIKGLFLQQNAHALIELSRQEKDPELKREIVSQLSLIHSKEATDYFMEILNK
jgi:tetratricopeptide (TPR) repeat protein